MTSKFTRERIELIANFHRAMTLPPSHDEIEELARMALAAMDSEPYGFTDGDRRGMIYEPQYADRLNNPLPVYRHAQSAPVVPEGLKPETTDLVLRFASALADKLYKAEQKYGRSTDWMKDDWYDDCLQSLWEHIEKGDPRDVAAYCAFMWYHGWVTPTMTGMCRTPAAQPCCRRTQKVQENRITAGEAKRCRTCRLAIVGKTGIRQPTIFGKSRKRQPVPQ